MSAVGVAQKVKVIEAYLARADELNGPRPVIAYFIRMYVVQRLMGWKKAGVSGLEATIIPVLDKLEGFKKTDAWIEFSREHPSDAEQQKQVTEFVLAVFKKADDADRAGVFNGPATVMQWMVTCKFLDVLEQFHPSFPGGSDCGTSPLAEAHLEQKRKYCKYKARYLRECIKKNEIPVPGPPGGEAEQNEDAERELALLMQASNTPTTTSPVGNEASASSTQGSSQNPQQHPSPQVVSPSVPPTVGGGMYVSGAPVEPSLGGSHSSRQTSPTPTPSAPSALPTAAATFVPLPISPVPPTKTSAPSGAELFARKKAVKDLCSQAVACLDFDDLNGCRSVLLQALQTLDGGGGGLV